MQIVIIVCNRIFMTKCKTASEIWLAITFKKQHQMWNVFKINKLYAHKPSACNDEVSNKYEYSHSNVLINVVTHKRPDVCTEYVPWTALCHPIVPDHPVCTASTESIIYFEMKAFVRCSRDLQPAILDHIPWIASVKKSCWETPCRGRSNEI